MSKMMEFDTLKDLQNDETLQNMGRYQWRKVKLAGEEVFACTTSQQYEDIIWGDIYEMFKKLFEHFEIEKEGQDITDCATCIRDEVLELLEKHGIKFVDVFEEY